MSYFSSFLNSINIFFHPQLVLQQGSFRGQQISSDCSFNAKLGWFLGPQRRETRAHSIPNYFYLYLLNQSAYIHIGDLFLRDQICEGRQVVSFLVNTLI